MAINKKQQIRGLRIILTVLYGFILSSILFRYIIHGIVETTRESTNAYAITMIVLGCLILISIGLATYATWFDNAIIMLVSGSVLIAVFILTLVFGIIRIMKTAPHRVIVAKPVSNAVLDTDEPNQANKTTTDNYILMEDVTKLIVELMAMLLAIIGTFILHRYIKSKYSPVSTTEPKPS